MHAVVPEHARLPHPALAKATPKESKAARHGEVERRTAASRAAFSIAGHTPRGPLAFRAGHPSSPMRPHASTCAPMRPCAPGGPTAGREFRAVIDAASGTCQRLLCRVHSPCDRGSCWAACQAMCPGASPRPIWPAAAHLAG